MKKAIYTLQAIRSNNTLTPNRIAFVEIVAHLVDKIRANATYKEARAKLFTDKGEAKTELTQAIQSENYGYTVTATIRKESSRVDWKAYALSLGGTEIEAKEQGYTTTTAGSTAIKVVEAEQ